MGALHFGLDPRLLEALRRQLPLSTFFETGTYKGGTTAAVGPAFERVYTVELSSTLYLRAREELSHLSHVEVIHGSSPEVLRARAPELSTSSVLYWLDAHWCGGVTGGTANECPILGELSAIGHLNDNSVILIDDARYFLGPPPAPHNPTHWPDLLELEAALRQISSRHKLWVIDDVMIYAPQRIADDVVAFSRAYSLDLAVLAQAARRAMHRDATTATPAGTPDTSRGNDHGLDVGFNRAVLSEQRSERIFTFHAKRLGVTRVLDVGSNSGQFATRLRRLGFDGIIYSVEPQSAAHKKLCQNARTDVRWIPLLRQAAGRVHGSLDLNLSENSWSSSFFPVHENHLRAAPATRMVAKERVFVTRAADLLREPLMCKIDALKIDVQGYELEVLEGLRSHMDGIRLILIEMSSVECYVGAPDLFTLDRFLVNELGFARVSLEPSYYDDRQRVLQQFDGIYARNSRANAVEPTNQPYAFGSIVTSMHGVPSRKTPSGEEYGGEWLQRCVDSWVRLSDSILSVSEAMPPDPRVQWVKTDSRPSVADVFTAIPGQEGKHTVFCNADIVLRRALEGLATELDPATVYLAHRAEVERNAADPQVLDFKKIYVSGFDVFILPSEFVRFVRDARAFPLEFRVGEPWWDILLPVLALVAGFPVKKLPFDRPYALHYQHPPGYSAETWFRLGETFLAAVEGLRSEGPFRARELLDDIDALTGAFDDRLRAAYRLVCSRIP